MRKTYLILPWNGDTADVKLAVEGVVAGIQIDTFDGGKLFYIQHIFTVYCTGLEGKKITINCYDPMEVSFFCGFE